VRAGRGAVLGIAQGAAEVEPVSSSAQLVLLPWLLGWDPPADRTAFGAGLHAGSCVGIAWALRTDLRRLSRSELATLAAASVPAAVAGALAADAVEQRLGRPPQLAGLLAAAGALMWWVDARAAARTPAPTDPMITPDPPGESRVIMGVTAREATLAAVAQVAALVPGVSRSGATLTALRAAGVDRAEARRFSLLMSLPITAGAAALSLARADRAVLRELGPALAAGTLTSAVAGAAAAAAHRRRPGRSLAGPALYRLGLAAVVGHRLIRKGVS
jgi:undecaprenyl-diphosphatase